MLIQLPVKISDGQLLIEPILIQQLERYRQLDTNDPESGGILMGFRKEIHIHVTECSLPTTDDIQTRFGFTRHSLKHQSVAVKRWDETNQTMDYIGEWHTHPEDFPVPSSTDYTNWKKITITRSNPMVFVIIGRKSHWVGIGFDDQIFQLLESPLIY